MSARPSFVPVLLSLVAIACGSGGGPSTPPPPPPPSVPASVVIAPATVALEAGAGRDLAATVRDAGGNIVSATVTWNSLTPAVATVNGSGRVTGVTVGSATITATAGTVQGTASVTVSQVPVASVVLSNVPGEVEIGVSSTLTAATRSATTAVLTGRTVTWSTSAPSVATVSQSGGVTGLTAGTTTITATSEGQSASVTLLVDTRAAHLNRLADSVRIAYDLPAMGVAIVDRARGNFGIGVAGRRRISVQTSVAATDLWHLGANLLAVTGFTAAVAVGQGALTWNTTIGQAYPELAGTMRPEYQNVTLRMLLGMVAGLPLNISDAQILGAGTLTEQRRNVAAWAVTTPTVATQGTYSASTVGYLIAANMVERAMNSSWEVLTQSLLLNPLGITQFGWGPAPFDQNQNPRGHRFEGGWVETTTDAQPYYSAAGRGHASLDAWGRLLQEILRAEAGQSAIVPQAVAQMMTSAIAPNYAGGWQISPTTVTWTTGPALSHNGVHASHYSQVQLAPTRGAAVLAVTNSSGSASNPSTAALAVMTSRLWKYFDQHQ